MTDLIQQIDARLQAFKYEQDHEVKIPDVSYISYVKNPAPLKVRNLVAVLDMPKNIVDQNTAKRYFEFVRKSLLDQYGQAFLWKELEIAYVVICEKDIFNILKEDPSKALSQAGFELNSMLGSCLISKENFDHVTHHTFGIYFSGDHFQALNKVVEDHCKSKKETAS